MLLLVYVVVRWGECGIQRIAAATSPGGVNTELLPSQHTTVCAAKILHAVKSYFFLESESLLGMQRFNVHAVPAVSCVKQRFHHSTYVHTTILVSMLFLIG